MDNSSCNIYAKFLPLTSTRTKINYISLKIKYNSNNYVYIKIYYAVIYKKKIHPLSLKNCMFCKYPSI